MASEPQLAELRPVTVNVRVVLGEPLGGPDVREWNYPICDVAAIQHACQRYSDLSQNCAFGLLFEGKPILSVNISMRRVFNG